MKYVVLVVFAAAFGASLLWLDAADRKMTRPQQTAIGVAALAGWLLVVVMGVTLL